MTESIELKSLLDTVDKASNEHLSAIYKNFINEVLQAKEASDENKKADDKFKESVRFALAVKARAVSLIKEVQG